MCNIRTNISTKALGWETCQSCVGGTMNSVATEHDTQPDDTLFEKAFCSIFPPDWLEKTAKETGLVKRERKINPVAIFWVLVLSYGVQLHRTLAELKRDYSKRNGTTLSDSSWYDRFTPELVLFLKTCVLHGIEHLSIKTNRRLSEKLSFIEDVLIQDNSIIRVHESLAKKFPAVRSRKVAAGIKVGLLVSAVANGPKKIGIYGERTSDYKTLKIGSWVKNRIILLDLGFYKHHTFVRIDENNGYFVSRLKGTANPLIIATNKTHRGNSIDVVGKRIKDVLPKLKRKDLDVMVEIEFKRRKYKGKQRKDRVQFRLVAVYNEEAKKYHLYLTNIGVELLDLEDIAMLYAARWEVELIFKELKSGYAMDKVKTKNPQVIEAFIWIAFLTMLASRVIHSIVRDHVEAQGKSVVRYTQLRWSKVFLENARMHLTRILDYCGFKNSEGLVVSVYTSQALDPHVNRHRFREEFWS